MSKIKPDEKLLPPLLDKDKEEERLKSIAEQTAFYEGQEQKIRNLHKIANAHKRREGV